MVRTDWDRILSVKAESLTDDEIEDLFPMVIRCDVDDVDSMHNLRALMRLSQEMLQHKDNQVESLLLECDELKEKVSAAFTASSKSKNIAEQVIASDEIERDISDSKEPDYPVNIGYQDTLKMNDKIKTLMHELETLEQENNTLKRKLEVLKEEMEDATESMNGMTEELEKLRSKNVMHRDEINFIQRENSALVIQIEEMTTQQAERDNVIDDFSAAIDSRVAEWKEILDEKDAEINRLRGDLSQVLTQSVTSVREQNKSQIVHLNEEIDQREKIIIDLQSKLMEATVEINESAALIEKLKTDAKKLEKTGRRKDHRDLLKKVQEANEKIAVLQDSLRQAEEDVTLKSQQLCEALGNLKKYEDRDHGLAETIKEVKELKEELNSKNDHVQDLVNVINNLEKLNSRREMQIQALREKLGMPEDEEISIEGIALKSQEEARIRKELIKKNESLVQENLEMKSDIRTLRYKLSKVEEKAGTTRDTIDRIESKTHSDEIVDSKHEVVAEEEIVSLQRRTELDVIKDNVRIVIEENEALRKGMHEILDSIHDQDGKSEVEVHSGTLERLLEALDVRHIAGWYHPAMRLQERLNVVQGSNSELRLQLKQMRKELHRKDKLLSKCRLKGDVLREKRDSDESENEEMKVYLSEIQRIQTAYRDELENWQKEKDSLNEKNEELSETIEKLTAQIDILDKDFKILESGDDEIKQSFAAKSRECAESVIKMIVANRKCKTVENLLNTESAKYYRIQKEATDIENALRKIIADMDKRSKLLESEIGTLQSNLSNSVSSVEYNELKDKYEETCMQLRMTYELYLATKGSEELVPSLNITESPVHQNVVNLETLHDISQNKLAKCESNLKQLTEINSELRQQILGLQNELSKHIRPRKLIDEDKSNINEEYEEKIRILTIENENLSRTLEICREEAQMQYTTNSLRTFELDSLRHQILDLHAVSEDKETIARLGFELTNCKAAEIEMSKRKMQLENEILHLREDLDNSNKKVDDARSQLQDCRKICATRCRSYEDVIDFLRCQYAGSTSVTALQRFDSMLKNLVDSRTEIDEKVKETVELKESAKLHKELLTSRLEIVEKLKDILEQQIGSPDIENMMHSFSETSQYTLNDIRLKRRITQLENELRYMSNKLIERESTIVAMEYEMINIQRIWYKKPEATLSVSEPRIETKEPPVEKISVFTEARVENQSVEVQSEPYDFGEKLIVPVLPEVLPIKQIETVATSDDTTSLLRKQLDQALSLASERSALLIKYESQITVYEEKIRALDKALADKDSQLSRPVDSETESKKMDEPDPCAEGTDKAALKSTINSLQKMITQKEETISRYQNLLKDDRDEHSKAAARFQEEIKALREEILALQEEAERKYEMSPASVPATSRTLDEPVKDLGQNFGAEEKIARLCERASTLEADLNIAKELGDRWHRLAEERLHHMDHMRERLEEQHKNELESYRLELNKWQNEADTLRQQLSENRMQLAKGNILMMKELQERDDKIQELNVAYQQLQTEFDVMETMTLSQQLVVHGNCETKMQEMAHALGRDQAQHFHSEIDLLRRQIKSQADREKMYKDQIADLKQQLSRRYMATKSEEKRISNREAQLEKKLKMLDEELHKARIQLDKEYRVQEAKRVKTAMEFTLWEKQKKWQRIAEKAKKDLKDKTEECKKLHASYEKMRAVVTCMEREKWYLRSKLRTENAGSVSGSGSEYRYKIVESLQIECQTLRDRIKELTDRLESEDNHQLLEQLEQQRSRIAALEAVTEGNSFVIEKLEKLEAAKSNLEKTNIRLETENFELRMEMEKMNLDTPRLREKVEHLEKYVELLKIEKSSDSSPRSSDKDMTEPKKSVMELEKTVFVLKRVIEKLQVENKRLILNAKTGRSTVETSRTIAIESGSLLQRQYEQAQKRVIILEADLQLAEQRVAMLESARKEEDETGEVGVLRQQLAHKSELLDKVKQLLTRAAINEKALRQRIQQIELKQTLSTIPECSVSSSSTN